MAAPTHSAVVLKAFDAASPLAGTELGQRPTRDPGEGEVQVRERLRSGLGGAEAFDSDCAASSAPRAARSFARRLLADNTKQTKPTPTILKKR